MAVQWARWGHTNQSRHNCSVQMLRSHFSEGQQTAKGTTQTSENRKRPKMPAELPACQARNHGMPPPTLTVQNVQRPDKHFECQPIQSLARTCQATLGRRVFEELPCAVAHPATRRSCSPHTPRPGGTARDSCLDPPKRDSFIPRKSRRRAAGRTPPPCFDVRERAGREPRYLSPRWDPGPRRAVDTKPAIQQDTYRA